MADLPFRVQAGSSASGGSSGDNSFIGRGGEDAEVNGKQGAAPGGRFPQDDLPMNAAIGNASGWTEGFSPSPENPPLPSSPTDGVGMTPNGTRR